MAPIDWRDLERDFTELHRLVAVIGCRIDRTWGEGRNDTWRVAGGVRPLERSRFESLATMAGRLLDSIDSTQLDVAVIQERDPYRRWLQALWSAAQPSAQYAIEKHQDGTETVLFLGSLDAPAAVSATLCLHFAAHAAPVAVHLDNQLAAPRYASVQAHWSKANEFLNASPADLPNAAKEAVSAVEGMAQLVTKQSGMTLRECIKSLRDNGTLAAPLLKGLDELWGFTSNSPGVRHGSAKTPTITVAEARYVVDQAAAGLRLLLTLDGAA